MNLSKLWAVKGTFGGGSSTVFEQISDGSGKTVKAGNIFLPAQPMFGMHVGKSLAVSWLSHHHFVRTNSPEKKK